MSYNLSADQKEAIFEQITSLYDLTDGIANAIGMEGVKYRTEQLDVAKPLIMQLYTSTDRISEIYTDCMKNDVAITAQQKTDLENAFASVFRALKEFSDAFEQLPRN